MNIPFNYQVASVDKEARCMEVIYTSQGRTPVHVGVRIPNEGESLDEVIVQHAPWGIWLERETVLADIEVGTSGSFTPNPTPTLSLFERTRQEKLWEIADWRFFHENAGITVDGFKVATDRVSRTALADAQQNLTKGVLAEVQWKGMDGAWKTFDAAGLEKLRAAVFVYVQGCYNAEAALVALVNEARSVEEIKGITLPEVIFNGAA